MLLPSSRFSRQIPQEKLLVCVSDTLLWSQYIQAPTLDQNWCLSENCHFFWVLTLHTPDYFLSMYLATLAREKRPIPLYLGPWQPERGLSRNRPNDPRMNIFCLGRQSPCLLSPAELAQFNRENVSQLENKWKGSAREQTFDLRGKSYAALHTMLECIKTEIFGLVSWAAQVDCTLNKAPLNSLVVWCWAQAVQRSNGSNHRYKISMVQIMRNLSLIGEENK